MSESTLLDGKALSEKMRVSMQERIERLVQAGNERPVLATILVGSDPASATYVRMKGRACEAVGMLSERIELPGQKTTEQLLKVIDTLNANPQVRGILLQHPVPEQIDERLAFDRIDATRDVDGVTTLGFGKISFADQAYPSCTPAGIMRLLAEYDIALSGLKAVVIGRSPILGKPMAMLLLNANCTVTICHSRTVDLAREVSEADLVVAACGKPRLLRGEWLKPGVIVVDAGYNPGNVGDADFESCAQKAAYITPVPGGVGPMTITMLLEHTVQSAERHAGLMSD